MSGRGGRGRGRGAGRGGGRRFFGKKKNDDKKDSTTQKIDLKFHPHGSGKYKQPATYTKVRDDIISKIQSEFDDSIYIVKSIRDEIKFDMDTEKPSLKKSTAKDATDKATEDEQYKIDYQLEREEFMKDKKTFDSNYIKAYALIYREYCSTAMQSQLRELPEFESRIQDDPVELLMEVQKLMHVPLKAVYPMWSLAETFANLVNLRQKEGEDLIGFTERFKQEKNIVKSLVGKHFLDNFIENTKEYAELTNDVDKKKMKSNGFDAFMATVFLRGSDRSSYGELIDDMRTQYALKVDQYPKSLEDAVDVMRSIRKKKKDKKEGSQNQRSGESDSRSQGGRANSFAQQRNNQDSKCYVCGDEAHKANECSIRGDVTPNQWFKKTGVRPTVAQQHLQQGGNGDDDESVESNADVSVASNRSSRSARNTGWSGAQIHTCHHQKVKKEQQLQQVKSGDYKYDLSQEWEDVDLFQVWALDSGTTCHLGANAKLGRGVRDIGYSFEIGTNAGNARIKEEFDVDLFDKPMQIPLHQSGMANVLGLCELVKDYRVTFDSAKQDAFHVHTKRGIVEFRRAKNGMYIYKPNSVVRKENHLETVEGNKLFFTKRQLKRAEGVRRLYHIVGAPYIESLKKLLAQRLIKNCPFNPKDVDVAMEVYGKSHSAEKGRAVRKKPAKLIDDSIEIPKELYMQNQFVDLCVDVMYVNSVLFLTSIDKTIRFRACVPLDSRKHEELLRAIQTVVRHYNQSGIFTQKIHCDHEFESMKDDLQDELDIDIRCENPGDHQPEAERNNRVLQERVRIGYHRMPYKALPRVLIRYLTMGAAKNLNMFPQKGGVSPFYSPQMILTQKDIDYNKHCVCEIGQYVLAFVAHEKTNTNMARSKDALYLRPDPNNDRGGHEVYDLQSKSVIHASRVETVPITEAVIERVESIAKEEGFKSLKFFNRKKEEIILPDADLLAGVDWLNTNGPLALENDEYEENEADEAEIANDEELEEGEYEEIDEDEVQDLLADEKDYQRFEQEQHPEQEDEVPEFQNEEEEIVFEKEEEDPEDDVPDLYERTETVDTDEEDEEEEEPAPTVRRSARARQPKEIFDIKSTKGKSYVQAGKSYLQAAKVKSIDGNANARLTESKKTIKFADDKDVMKMEMQHNLFQQTKVEDDICHEYNPTTGRVIARTIEEFRRGVKEKGVSFAQQYLLNKGLKKFGDRGAKAATAEMDQLYKRNCFEPILVKDLTPGERRKAQNAIMFLSEKRDGLCKGRMVYNGKPTRNWISREESASPTASIESVKITCAIDAKEGRDVMSADVPNAFIQTEMPKEKVENRGDRIIMKITGVLVDFLLDIDPKTYGGYVVMENGRKVIYVLVLRAIYGMLVASLLWYKKFRKDLETIGFEFNPYDPCVANRIVNGKQQTIRFHVDDILSSHVNPKVNDKFLKWLNKHYGTVKKVVATRGKVHEYLGMTIDFREKGKVHIIQDDSIENMLEEFPVKFKSTDTCSSPAANNLFEQGDSKLLNKSQSEIFHKFTAKNLFISHRARPDIQPTVSVLTTRVQKPNNQDWGKLVRLMKYLHSTRDKHLVLSVDKIGVVKWFVDASFAVHPDFKSHTGAVMTMGGGAVTSMSKKQKLNTRSSTSAELVGVDDVMTMILWNKLFIEAQGYIIKKNILYQDNKSSILLEVNGRKSAGKRSRALNIRYFFVTDQVAKGNLTIEYCPTDAMTGDYMTKPIQGEKFRVFRKAILGM